jgi:prostaglandin-endoperoxide synthase 2
MTRDTSRDGWVNRFRYWALTSAPAVWGLTNRTAPVHKRLNRWLIDNSIRMARTRPHPLSTMCDYSSVESLRDKTWFARHLPAVEPPKDLPEVDEVAKLFERRGHAKLSNKSTMLFATYAQWFTDGFLLSNFRAEPPDKEPNTRKNHSTHEFDLAQLYGTTREVTDQLRVRSERAGQRGRLKTQVFNGEEYPPFLYDERGEKKDEFSKVPDPVAPPGTLTSLQQKTSIFAFGGERSNTTPQTSMLNVLMLREHNRICSELESAYTRWDDERVFQTARNIMIALQLKIVVGEYINHISPYHHQFDLDPSVAWKADWNRPPWFAVEFNMLYRWHSLIPDEIHWGEKTYPLGAWLLDNRPLLESGLGFAFEATSAQPAAEVGLRNTAAALIGTERNAIQQGRTNRLATYNDYREAMKYPRAERFDQISSDPEIVAELQRLYRTVDRLEFYVGLFAEDARPNAAVPSLLGRMVSLDAFSQALVNPLCSVHVFNEATFSKLGWERIQQTHCLADLVARNVKGGRSLLVTMTQLSVAAKPGAVTEPVRARVPLRWLAEQEIAR